jgi:hypothetical protein
VCLGIGAVAFLLLTGSCRAEGPPASAAPAAPGSAAAVPTAPAETPSVPRVFFEATVREYLDRIEDKDAR